MPTISVCLVAHSHNNYDFLGLQNWTDIELVLCAKQSKIDDILNTLRDNNTFQYFKLLDLEKNNENDVVKACNGEYIVWVQKNENWSSDFLLQLNDFIFSNRTNSSILFGVGFLKQNLNILFAKTVYPFLHKKFSIRKIFLQPLFLIPSIKFIWKREVIDEYGLMFDQTLESHLLREAVFNLDYLTTCFQINGYSENSYASQPLSFYHPINNESPGNFLDIYREKIRDKKHIFTKNPWSKVYWSYQRALHKMRKENK